MNRQFSFLLLFLCVASYAFAHGIVVTKPAEGSQIRIGTQQTIEWQVENVKDVHVYLQSMPGRTSSTIKESLANTGTYSWTVAESTKPGQYRVLVVSTEDTEVHGVSKVFDIVQ